MSQESAPAGRISAPMYFPPKPFDLDLARRCNAKVNVAYDMYTAWLTQGKPKQVDFDWEPPADGSHYSKPLWGTDTVFWFFHHFEPFALLSWDDSGDVFLVFRGTESPDDWVEDADADHEPFLLAKGYGEVHHGFNTIYTSMSEAVRAALVAVPQAKRLIIAGHSLGSSLSTLAVPDIITNTDFNPSKLPVLHYNFACPRTGDPAFATAYNRNGVQTWRLVNSCDLVPELPPSLLGEKNYAHVGVQVSFTAQYDRIGDNHSNVGSYGYALDHPEQPQGPIATG